MQDDGHIRNIVMLSVIFYLENPLHLMDPAMYVTAHHSDATA